MKIGLKFIRRAQNERFSASGSQFEKRQRLANKFAEAISSGFCRRKAPGFVIPRYDAISNPQFAHLMPRLSRPNLTAFR